MSEQHQVPAQRWVIVEIMGHRVVAGRLAWGEVPYDKGVAVDVPLPPPACLVEGGANPAASAFLQEFYGAGAIFGLRIVPEAVARREAEESWHVRGIARALLPAPQAEEEDDEDERPDARADVYQEIDEALEQRDPDEDDRMPSELWTRTVRLGMEEAERQAEDNPEGCRRQLIDVAARIVAAIEAHDRREAGAICDPPEDDEDDPEDDVPDEAEIRLKLDAMVKSGEAVAVTCDDGAPLYRLTPEGMAAAERLVRGDADGDAKP